MGRNEKANVALDDWLVLGLNVRDIGNNNFMLCVVWFKRGSGNIGRFTQ